MENSTIKILAIDDNPDNLISLRALISEAFSNVAVISSTSGKKGLELAKQEDPDVILLDVIMPEMDGFEVCENLKLDAKLSQIPVVFITALKDDKSSRIRALDYGAEAFLSKPIDMSELTAQIKAMIKIKRANKLKTSEKDRLAALVSERTRELKSMHLATLNLLEDLSKENEARKKSEDALRESEQRFRSVLQSANDAIITTDSEGTIHGWNMGATKIFGYYENEIIGKSLHLIMPNSSMQIHLESIQKIENGTNQYDSNQTFELSGISKLGREFPVELSLAQWETSKGKFYTAIIRDISEREEAKQALISAKEKAEESDRLKSAFLANMSHEIRTPMNGILGFAELLKEPKLSGESQQKYIDIIQKSGHRMLNIINDIIDISKIESGQMNVLMSETNVNKHMEYMYTFFKPEMDKKNIQFTYHCALNQEDAIIQTDSEKIYAVLTNLIKNAVKFTTNGTISIGYTAKDNDLEFYVKDTGVGINTFQKEIIFERFRQGSESLQRNYEGAGLGLAISKAYIEMLGGKIWVNSEINKGSEFYFTIPYRTNKKVVLPTAPSTKEESKNQNLLNILIAEDDEASAMYVKTIISKYCKTSIMVESGLDAVKKCQENPNLDLILMDIRMPGLDGYSATKKIREFNTDVIIIAQTAFSFAGDREKALEAGCNDYISKPIRKNDLYDLINKYFFND